MFHFTKSCVRWLLMTPALLGLAAYTNTAHGQPNIVLIMVDDLSPIEDLDDPLAANVYRTSSYPNIDSLASQGMKFRTMYATAICSSSRVELMTGQYGFNNGYYNIGSGPYNPLPTSPYYDVGAKQGLAKILRAKNYKTGLVGKWQLPGNPLLGMVYDTGYEEYYVWLDAGHLEFYTDILPPGSTTSRYWEPLILDNGNLIIGGATDYGPEMFADWAVDFIDRHKDERFFLYYPMVLVHKQEGAYPDVPDGNGGTNPGSLRSHVDYVDLIVGRIVSAIDDAQITNDTMVIFTADNGSQWPGHKGTPTEQGVRVPFIVKYPGVVKADVSSRQVTDFVDIARTIHDYTGPARIPIADPMFDGTSLRQVLEDSTQSGTIGPSEPHKLHAFSYYKNMRVIRDDEYIYQEVDENGDGNLFYCGLSRNFSACVSSTDAAKIDEFKQALVNLPPPDIEGQELKPP